MIFRKLGNLVEFESDVYVVVLFLAAELDKTSQLTLNGQSEQNKNNYSRNEFKWIFRFVQRWKNCFYFRFDDLDLILICFLFQIDLREPKMLNNLEQGGGGEGVETNEEVKKHLWYLQEYLQIKFIFERAHLKCTVLMVL